MIPTNLETATFADLSALLLSGLREGRTLEFKREPIGHSDRDKREFLADVSALANTAGGDLVIGVEEEGGVPTAVPGISLADPDAEILRLEQMLRAGLEPRLPGPSLRWISSDDGRGLLVIRAARRGGITRLR